MFNQDEINIYSRDTQPRVKGHDAAGDEMITEH